MTKLLERAFLEISKLPHKEQNTLAKILLDEIASEEKWAALFAKSQDTLASLAEEALVEFKKGKTKRIRKNGDFSHH